MTLSDKQQIICHDQHNNGSSNCRHQIRYKQSSSWKMKNVCINNMNKLELEPKKKLPKPEKKEDALANLRQKPPRPQSVVKRFLYLMLFSMVLVPSYGWSFFGGRSVENSVVDPGNPPRLASASSSAAANPSTDSLIQQIYFRNSTRIKNNQQQQHSSSSLDDNTEPKSNLNVSSHRVNDRNSLEKHNEVDIDNGSGSNSEEGGKKKVQGHGNGHGQGPGHGNHRHQHKNNTNCEDEKSEDDSEHGVEDILRQIFGADDLDEEEDEFEDDEEFLNEQSHRGDIHVSKEYLRSNGTRIEHHSRKIRSPQDARRGPLEIEENDEEAQEEGALPNQGVGSPRKQPIRKRPQAQPSKKKGAGQNAGGNGNAADKKADNLAKYNAYMDAVFARMNTLIKKKRMDPLRVNLYAGPSKGPGAGPKAGNKNTRHSNKTNKNSRLDDDEDDESSSRSSHDEDDLDDGSTSEDDDDDDDDDVSGDEERKLNPKPYVKDVHLGNDAFGRSIRSLLANISQFSDAVMSDPSLERVSSASYEGEEEEEARGNIDGDTPKAAHKHGGNRPNSGGGDPPKRGKQNNQQHKNSTRPGHGGGNGKGKPGGNKGHKKNQHKNKNAPRPTRGILNGLSSLRRDGNVQVVKDGVKARLVRSKFLLGPVALEILPKKGKVKGTSREDADKSTSGSGSTSPAATATAPQLRGILEIRLTPNRPTRIRRLRVFPPGNVQVQGDKTSDNSLNRGSGYRKITPQATARLRQTAIQVVRQVDNKIRPKNGNKKKKGQQQKDEQVLPNNAQFE